MPTTDVIERWLLDVDQYKAELKNLAGEIREQNRHARDAELVQKALAESMGRTEEAVRKTAVAQQRSLQSWADYKAAIDVTIGVIRKVAGAFDELMDRGDKYGDLLANTTIDVDKASDAVDGMISKFDLLKAANTASIDGLQLTNEQFQQMAIYAKTVADKLAIDETAALDKLSAGLLRATNRQLRLLGLTIDASQAYVDYAAKIGQTTDLLTEIEKTEARRAAVLAKLGDVVREGGVKAANAAEDWLKLKVGIRDTWDVFAKFMATAATGHEEVIWRKVSEARAAMEARGLPASSQMQLSSLPAGVQGMAAESGPMVLPLDIFHKTKKGAAKPKWDVSAMAPAFGGGGELGAGQAEKLANLAAIDANILADDRWADSQRRLAEAFGHTAEMMAESNSIIQYSADVAGQFGSTVAQLGEQLITDLAGGFLGAADAAISSGQNIGIVALNMLKSITLGLASQLMAHAIHAKIMATTAAMNPLNPVMFASAPLWAAQAVSYGVGAGVVGALGLGLSVAGAAAGGTGAFASGGGAGRGASAGGVDRGLGGPASGSASRGGGNTLSFYYNINTITPPDEDAAAAFIASSVNRARAMGFLAN
jgi:hypothetical protein